MKLGRLEHWVQKKSDGVYSTLTGTWKKASNDESENILLEIRSIFSSKKISEDEKEELFKKKSVEFKAAEEGIDISTIDIDAEILEEEIKRRERSRHLRNRIAQSLMNFFSEFQFEPNFRFVNTLAYASCISRDEALKYVSNYFELSDSPDLNIISEKINSKEFSNIIDLLRENGEPATRINNRFRIYYGSQGTGKTTKAMQESDNSCMVCHSAMLPSDLMEDFKFEDGKAIFTPSALQKAIVEGKKITLDEINLLPFESLRFLQSILDGKEEFTYKGKTIKIADGFQIIGTMNLVVNSTVYSLPEPLIDRCQVIRKYQLTADALASAI